MNVRTYGDLMDMANTISNNNAKVLLRESFQKYCRENNLSPMTPTAVGKWRSEYISENEAGILIMAAFGLSDPKDKSDAKPSVEDLRAKYPEGTLIELISMDDIQAPPSGTLGTVDSVDDAGTIHMKWDNGSSLGLCPEVDKFKIVGEV